MPRKVNYGVNYEGDFDDYEDYGYDYDDGYGFEEEDGTPPETRSKQELVNAGIWCCPICTFDNEDTMNACDICGVIRYPLVKNCAGSKENAAKDDLKDSDSPSKTRGKDGVTSSLNNMSISSKPRSVDTEKSDSATSISKNKPQRNVQPPQIEDKLNQSCNCWPCGFWEVNIVRKVVTPFGADIPEKKRPRYKEKGRLLMLGHWMRVLKKERGE